jgi:hypothetical protein
VYLPITNLMHCCGLNLFSKMFLYLQAVNGGIVMVSFFNNFLSCTDTATLHDVIGMSSLSSVPISENSS